MSDDRSPLETAIEQALDAFVYAPIGLLFDGPELFPKLAERGRNQVRAARMMGEMAVRMGQSEAGKRLAATDGPLRDVLSSVGIVPPPAPAPTPAPAPAAPAPAAEAAPTPTDTPAASADALPITDYDSLSASQVVSRLQGLAPDDLDAVRAYEAATRSRKTILNRITQLQKG